MAMWSSRTSAWGKKTRPVANGSEEPEKDEAYLEVEDQIKAMEAEIKHLKDRLNEKCMEIVGLNIQLKVNAEFMQQVVMELIRVKANTPAAAPAKSPLEAYKEKKASELSVKEAAKAAEAAK